MGPEGRRGRHHSILLLLRWILLVLLLQALQLFEALVVDSDLLLFDLIGLLVAQTDPDPLGFDEVAVFVAVLVQYATDAILLLYQTALVVRR